VKLKACIEYLEAMYPGNDIANTRWNASTVKCSVQKDSTSCGVLALEHACCLLIGKSLVDINTSKAGILQLRHRITQELRAGRLTGVEQVAIPLAEESPLQSPPSAVQTTSATAQSWFMAMQTLSPGAQSPPIAIQIASSAAQTPSPSSGAQSPFMPVQTPSPGVQSPPIATQIASSVRYIDRPTRPAEACLDRCEQMRTREASGGAGGQWPPATSRPGDI